MTQGLHVTGIEFVPVLGLPSKVTAALQSVTDNQLFPHSTCFADRETVWRSTSWPCSPSKGPHIPDGAEWKLTSSELKLRLCVLPQTVGNARSAAAAGRAELIQTVT